MSSEVRALLIVIAVGAAMLAPEILLATRTHEDPNLSVVILTEPVFPRTYVEGEILNRNTYEVSNVYVQVSFASPRWGWIGQNGEAATPSTIPAGGRAKFLVNLGTSFGVDFSYSIRVQAGWR